MLSNYLNNKDRPFSLGNRKHLFTSFLLFSIIVIWPNCLNSGLKTYISTMNLQRREINGCGLIKKCKEKKKSTGVKMVLESN